MLSRFRNEPTHPPPWKSTYSVSSSIYFSSYCLKESPLHTPWVKILIRDRRKANFVGSFMDMLRRNPSPFPPPPHVQDETLRSKVATTYAVHVLGVSSQCARISTLHRRLLAGASCSQLRLPAGLVAHLLLYHWRTALCGLGVCGLLYPRISMFPECVMSACGC